MIFSFIKRQNFFSIYIFVSISLAYLFSPFIVSSSFAFSFVAWGDTKKATSVLAEESKQVKALNPVFTIYSGDLIDSGSSTSLLDTWKNALNGGVNNGLFDITFPVRGNHDSSTSALWPNYFDLRGNAAQIGASNYTELNPDTTYSFDYGNSHFVGIDVMGNASKMSTAQITWLDNDLTSAENRGIVHSFLYWHGPLYPMSGHCCQGPNPDIVPVLNKHQSLSAIFHGHEHVVSHVHINNSRVQGITHEFEQFISGDAGAGPGTCQAGRFDYCMSNDTRKHGFILIEVNGNSFVANFYSLGNNTPEKTITVTKNDSTNTTPQPSANSSPNPSKLGDVNKDGKINIVDIGLIVDSYGSSPPINLAADLNNDGKINIVDIGIVIDNYGH